MLCLELDPGMKLKNMAYKLAAVTTHNSDDSCSVDADTALWPGSPVTTPDQPRVRNWLLASGCHTYEYDTDCELLKYDVCESSRPSIEVLHDDSSCSSMDVSVDKWYQLQY